MTYTRLPAILENCSKTFIGFSVILQTDTPSYYLPPTRHTHTNAHIHKQTNLVFFDGDLEPYIITPCTVVLGTAVAINRYIVLYH